MSKVLIGRQPWADMTEARAACVPAVRRDSALADKADMAESVNADRERRSLVDVVGYLPHSAPSQTLRATPENLLPKDKNASRRFGLPTGFVSRLGRYGRSVLLEDNVYRLPNGIEFIPQPPEGTLGSRNHQYALSTSEQYIKGQRGSMYVRHDGRIFDYAYDHNEAERDMFDTGFTIHDLERTGRYAPELKSRSFSLRKRGKKQRARRR
jgi:hypothetical protein